MKTKLKPETSKALSDMEALIAVMERARGMATDGVLPAPPPMSFTVPEYARRMGMHRRTAEDQMMRLTKLGQFERARAFGPTSNGRVMPQWYYWEKAGK